MITYYIAPGGDDDASGSFSEPFATIGHAQSVVRAAIAGGMTEDVVVRLREGRYEIATGLVFGAADAGRDGHLVVWEGYPGEAASISGGFVVTGWTPHANGIYKADVGIGRATRSIYVNGARATRARGSLNPAGWTRTSTGYITPDASMAGWGNPTKIEIVSRGNWVIHRLAVASIAGAAITMADPAWSIQQELYIGWAIRPTPSWVENALELLDAAGEWYLDETTGLLYYKPVAGSMDGLEVIVPAVETLVTCDGTSALRFHNIRIEHSNWLPPPSGYLSDNNYYQVSLPYYEPGAEVLPTAAVVVTGSSNVKFTHSEFVHMSSALTFALLNGSSDVAVRCSYFDDLAGASLQGGDLQIGGVVIRRLEVDNCHFGPNRFYDYEASATLTTTWADETTFSHNVLEHNGLGWAGIALNGSGDNPLAAHGKSSNASVVRNRIVYAAPAVIPDGAPVYILQEQSEAKGFADGLVVMGNHVNAGASYYGFYNDFDAAWMVGNDNLVQSADWFWLTMSSTSNNITWNGNYTSQPAANVSAGENVVVSDTTTVPAIPAEGPAKAIMNRAGVRTGIRPGLAGNTRTPLWAAGTTTIPQTWPTWGD